MRVNRLPIAIGMAVLSVAMLVSSATGQSEPKPPPCAAPSGPPAPLTPTTADTVEQAYRCVFDHYFSGSTLDGRSLLTAAFVGLTQELQRQGIEQADATMPALTGDRDGDWAAFRPVYLRLTNRAAKPEVRQALASSAMTAMLVSLHDNHARWIRPVPPPDAKPGTNYGLGITRVSGQHGSSADPVATPPLFVISVDPGSPVAQQDVRPGDVIVSVNGSAPFADGVLSTGALNLINAAYPDTEAVRLTLHRPSTGRTWPVTVKPALYAANPPGIPSKLLPGDVAYVSMPGFFPGSADQVLQAIAKLREGRTLRGVVLDLRGNRGGSPDEVNKLLGAFVHDKTTAYYCDVVGSCEATRTDDAVPLVNLPLVTLTDRSCGSACDHFTSAVKDLQVGPLVGTRTAGVVSGPAAGFILSDNSLLLMPARHHLGPNKEAIDGIGVPPDHYIPLTAADLSAGRDPAVTKALSLIKR